MTLNDLIIDLALLCRICNIKPSYQILNSDQYLFVEEQKRLVCPKCKISTPYSYRNLKILKIWNTAHEIK